MNKQLLSFNVMKAVETSYTGAKLTDGEFAKMLTESLGILVSTARVRQARSTLGIPPQGKADLKSLLADIIKNLNGHPGGSNGLLDNDILSRIKEVLK